VGYDVGFTSGFFSNAGRVPQIGDMVLAIHGVATDIGGDLTLSMATAGFTKIADVYSPSTYSSHVAISYRFLSGTIPSLYSVTGVGGSNAGQSCNLYVLRGVNQTTPFDVSFTTATSTGITFDPPPITPVTPGAWVVIGGYIAGELGPNNTGFSPPPDLVNLSGWGVPNFANPPYAGQRGGMFTNWSSGSYNPGAWTPGYTATAASSWCAVTMVLRPA
jgi:hypothetical protein